MFPSIVAPSCQESGVAEWLEVAVMALRLYVALTILQLAYLTAYAPTEAIISHTRTAKHNLIFSDSTAITFDNHAHLTLRPRHHSSHCSCRAAGKEPGIGFARRARGFLKSQSGLSQDLAPLISKHGHDNLSTMVRATTAVVMLICSQDPIH